MGDNIISLLKQFLSRPITHPARRLLCIWLHITLQRITFIEYILLSLMKITLLPISRYVWYISLYIYDFLIYECDIWSYKTLMLNDICWLGQITCNCWHFVLISSLPILFFNSCFFEALVPFLTIFFIILPSLGKFLSND